MRRLFGLGLLVFLVACRSVPMPVGAAQGPGAMAADAFVTADDVQLRLHVWAPDADPRAVVLALHGFNDHGGSFAAIAEAFTDAGVALYAFDQRGFGESEHAGLWPGKDVLAGDARLALDLLRTRYPHIPLYLLGKSMGGAVAMLLMADEHPPELAGTLLLAPAVVGETVMPGHQRVALWLAERLVPGLPLSVELGQALGYRPSDQEEVMAALRDDPLVLDHPRVEAVAGLAELMHAALVAAPAVTGEVLLLYGSRDDLVPGQAICKLLGSLGDSDERGDWRVRHYPDGFHMLTRYSGAATTRADLLDWITGAGGDGLLEPEEAMRELECRR